MGDEDVGGKTVAKTGDCIVPGIEVVLRLLVESKRYCAYVTGCEAGQARLQKKNYSSVLI